MTDHELQLREQIANDLAKIWHEGNHPDPWQAMATYVLNLFKQKGYIELANNQDLPELNLPKTDDKAHEITMRSFAKSVQNNMVKAGFRKVNI